MSEARDRAWTALRQAPQVGLDLIGPRSDPWSAWARGALIMSMGDYARAIGGLEPLTFQGDEVGGLAAARIASGLRQLDDHAAAVGWDERAMAASGQAVVDGIVGRAADAVGATDVELAARLLSQAHDQAATVRDEIRIAWVACEVSLLQGQAQLAAAHAHRSHRMSLALGSPRHVVKSALFWAAAVRSDDPQTSLDLLQRGFARAQALSLRPMMWPMVNVMGHRAGVEQVAAAGQAVRYIEAHLPEGAGEQWRRRGDIAQLRDTGVGSPG